MHVDVRYIFVSDVPVKKSLQKKSNLAEYVVTKLDDLLNWGRKVNRENKQ